MHNAWLEFLFSFEYMTSKLHRVLTSWLQAVNLFVNKNVLSISTVRCKVVHHWNKAREMLFVENTGISKTKKYKGCNLSGLYDEISPKSSSFELWFNDLGLFESSNYVLLLSFENEDCNDFFSFQGNHIQYSGDPLQDFTLMRFLDRFVYRNPKPNKGKGKHCYVHISI